MVHSFSPQQDLLATNGQILMTFGLDILDPMTMNPKVFEICKTYLYCTEDGPFLFFANFAHCASFAAA